MRLYRHDVPKYIADKYGVRTAASTLAKKAVDGMGPPYQIFGGRAVYETDDVDKWILAQLGPKIRNTAQRGDSILAVSVHQRPTS